MMLTFLYKIHGWNSLTDDEHYDECGLVYSDSFTSAVHQIEEHYGEELISILSVEAFDTCVFRFDPKHYDTIKAIAEACQ